MWLVLSHQEPQTQYKSEIKEKTLSRQESLDGLRISQKSAKTPLFTEFSDGLGGGNSEECQTAYFTILCRICNYLYIVFDI
jgi:hypothetical protein